MTGLISFVFAVAMTPWRAFVLLKLWFWFLVPVWPMLAVPKWNLYGLALIIGWLAAHVDADKQKKTEWPVIAAISFLGPAMILLTGWIIKIICL